jgi:hypothetical protein
MAWIAWEDLFGSQLHHGFQTNPDPERFLRYLRPLLEKTHAAGGAEGE